MTTYAAYVVGSVHNEEVPQSWPEDEADTDDLKAYVDVAFGPTETGRDALLDLLKSVQRQLQDHVGELFLVVARKLAPRGAYRRFARSVYTPVETMYELGVSVGDKLVVDLREDTCGLPTHTHLWAVEPHLEQLRFSEGSIIPPVYAPWPLLDRLMVLPRGIRVESRQTPCALEVVIGNTAVTEWFRAKSSQQLLRLYCAMAANLGQQTVICTELSDERAMWEQVIREELRTYLLRDLTHPEERQRAVNLLQGAIDAGMSNIPLVTIKDLCTQFGIRVP
jgi:hypothetical protein